MRSAIALGVAILVGACAQLPATSAIGINTRPVFESSAIVSSKNGLLAVDLTKVPGAVCIPDNQGKCDSDGFLPAPVRSNGSTIAITASTDTTPKYHALVDNKYSVGGSVPFLTASGSSDVYDEVTATILATATFSDSSPNSGYPSIDQIRSALHQVGRTNVPYVYWLSAANVISVTKKQFRKVESAANVTVTGIGINGSTYNSSTRDDQTVWIGIFAHRIELIPSSAPQALMAGGLRSPSGGEARRPGPVLQVAPIQSLPVVK